MKKTILFFFVSLISLGLFSQNLSSLTATGNSWGVSFSSAYGIPDSYTNGVTRFIDKDTLIGNVQYKILHSRYNNCYCQPGDHACFYGVKCSSSSSKNIIRQVGNQLFEKLENAAAEVKLVEFKGLKVGDSVFVDKRFRGNSSNGKFIISKIEVTTSQNRKKYWLEGYNGFYLDGIGFSGGGIFPEPTRSFESGSTLNCFTGNGIGYRTRDNFAPSTPCFIVNSQESAVSEIQNITIKRMSESQLQLDFPYETGVIVSIINLNGNISFVRTCTPENNSINISSIPPGVYIGKAETSHSSPFTFRFIK